MANKESYVTQRWRGQFLGHRLLLFLGGNRLLLFFWGGGASNIISEPNLDIFGSTAKKRDIEIEN
jgi:hypothetical protein